MLGRIVLLSLALCGISCGESDKADGKVETEQKAPLVEKEVKEEPRTPGIEEEFIEDLQADEDPAGPEVGYGNVVNAVEKEEWGALYDLVTEKFAGELIQVDQATGDMLKELGERESRLDEIARARDDGLKRLDRALGMFEEESVPEENETGEEAAAESVPDRESFIRACSGKATSFHDLFSSFTIKEIRMEGDRAFLTGDPSKKEYEDIVIGMVHEEGVWKLDSMDWKEGENPHAAKSRQLMARAGIEALKVAVMTYRMIHNKLPDSLEVLLELKDGKTNLLKSEELIDPWGNAFVYTLESRRKYTIISLGADGQEGGTDEDADIAAD